MKRLRRLSNISLPVVTALGLALGFAPATARADEPMSPEATSTEPAPAPEPVMGPLMPVPAVIVRSPYRVSRPVGQTGSSAAEVLPAPATTMPGPWMGAMGHGAFLPISQPVAAREAAQQPLPTPSAPAAGSLMMAESESAHAFPGNAAHVGTAVTFHTGSLLAGGAPGTGLGYTRVSTLPAAEYRIAKPGVAQAVSAHPSAVRVSLMPTAGSGKVARFSVVTPTSVVVTGATEKSSGTP